MRDSIAIESEAPLRLDSAWQLRESDRSANIHTLRVIPGAPRHDMMDHDALRVLVAEIVREELRSELGRRMTASIRRFVSDEVARIFARLAR